MKNSDYLNYIIEHVDQLKTLLTGGFFIAAFFVKKIFSKQLSASRVKSSIKKQQVYLGDYGEFLSDEDKKYIKSRSNDEVMKSVMGFDYLADRKDLLYISNRVNDASVFYSLVKLKKHLVIGSDGRYSINFKNSRAKLFRYFAVLAFLLTLAFGYVFLALSLIEQRQYISGALFMLFGIIFSFSFAWYTSTLVSNSRIDKINDQLAAIPPAP